MCEAKSVGGWRPPSASLPEKWGCEHSIVPPCSYAYGKWTEIRQINYSFYFLLYGIVFYSNFHVILNLTCKILRKQGRRKLKKIAKV